MTKHAPRKLLAMVLTITLMIAFAQFAVVQTASARVTVTFPFEDARLLKDGEHDGGKAIVPDGVDLSRAPLIVFLHGKNGRGPKNSSLAYVRSVVDRLVASGRIEAPIVASPSQTKDASKGSHLFPAFSLEAFVDATQAALPAGVVIDRRRVILVGHSGGGCNLEGGIVTGAGGTLHPRAVIAIDTCLDGDFGRAYHATAAPLLAYWESFWRRDVRAFDTELVGLAAYGPPILRRTRLLFGLGRDLDTAHVAILPAALEYALPQVLARN